MRSMILAARDVAALGLFMAMLFVVGVASGVIHAPVMQ
jgi:hypothetical protein